MRTAGYFSASATAAGSRKARSFAGFWIKAESHEGIREERV